MAVQCQRASVVVAIVAMAAWSASSLYARKVIVVTSTEDRAARRGPAPAGSLREAVEQLAEAFDIITFNVAGPVRLEAPLRIPADLRGLVIQGPATIAGGARGVLEITADGVSLQNLEIGNVEVVAGTEAVAHTGFFLFRTTFTGASALTVRRGRGCQISDNTFDVTGLRDTIRMERTEECTLLRNVITGPAKWQIADSDSLDLHLRNNTLSGGLKTTQRSGLVQENQLSDGRIRADFSTLPGGGLLRLEGNTAPGMTVQRTNVEIVRNTLTPLDGDTSAVMRLTNADQLAPTGEFLVDENTVDGGKTAIFYTETPTSVPGLIRGNEINVCSGRGLSVNSAVATLIDSNRISDCLVGLELNRPTGAAVRIERNRIEGSEQANLRLTDLGADVVVRSNLVTKGKAQGVVVQGGVGRALFEGNEIWENAGAGVAVGRSSHATLLRDHIFSNGGPGIEVAPDAIVAVSQISTSRNVGPGIDLAPSGVTPNPKPKKGNPDLDWPEQLVWDDDRLTGFAEPGSRVEVYIVETLPRTGNPLNGEGFIYVASGLANGAGRFDIPIGCIPNTLLTTTATLPADFPVLAPTARTSEFSENVACKPLTITALHLDKPADLVVGTDRGTALLNTVATDSAGKTRNVTTDPAVVYASSNPAVIEVSNAPASKGVITAKSAGEATLTAQIPASPGQPEVTSPPVVARSGDPLVIVTEVLPGAVDGQPYQAFVTALGGIGARTFTSVGAFPAGIGLNASTGEIAGTTSQGGSALVTVTVTDSSNAAQATFKVYSFRVLKVLPAELPDGTVDTAYESSAQASGHHPGSPGTTTVAFNIVAGRLPAGLVLSTTDNGITATATFAGTPTETGTFPFTLEVSDLVDGRKDTEQYTIVIEGDAECAVTASGSFGTVCGADPDNFSFSSIGGICQNCTGTHVSGLSFACAAGETCTLTDFFLTVAGGTMEGAGGSLDCEGATCNLTVVDERVSCDGPASACGLKVPPSLLSSCPDDTACQMLVAADLLRVASSGPHHSLEIRKTTTNPDDNATFEFEVTQQLSTNPPSSQTAQITTIKGVGSRALVIEGLRAGHNLRLREIVPAGWSLIDVTDADGLGFTWDRLSNLIDLGTLSDTVASQRHIQLLNRKLPGGAVRDTGRTLPEMGNETRTFGLPAGNRITIGGSNGFEIRDAITDQIPTAGSRLLSFPDAPKYGALVVEHPSGNGSDALFSHGPNGYAITQFFPDIGDFGFTQISFPPGQNFTDAIYFGDDPAANGVLAVNFTNNNVTALVWRDFSGELAFSPTGSLVTRFAVGNGTGFVSAFGSNLTFTPDGDVSADNTGWIATLLDGTPGKLWISDPRLPFGPGTFVGNVGNSPRRIRCLPSHNLCAVSNFESDSLTIVQWNGRETAALVGTQVVGDGPVGIDVRPDGVNAKVISTGFNDHTFTVTTLAPNGSVLSSVTQAVPAGCVNPGHALWLSGVPGTAVLTCKGSNKYALITP